MSESGVGTGESTDIVRTGRRTLFAEFELAFGSESACPVVEQPICLEPLDHHVADDVCHVVSADPASKTAVSYERADVPDACPCRIFAAHGCVPSIRERTSNGFVVWTNPPDRTVLRDLVADLREVVDTVRVRRIVEDGTETRPESALVDLDVLTEIERETIEFAIIAGYYDRSRSFSFEELAAEFDISTSALSKRLSSAEAKVIRELFQDLER